MSKNIIQSLLTKGMVALINFLILLVSSRYLGVNSRGEISIFLLNIFFIQVISEVYTGYSIIHFIPKYNFRTLFINGIIFALILCSISNTLVGLLGKQLIGYGWFGYIVSILVTVNTFNCVIILGKEKVKMYNLLCFIQPLTLLLGILTLVLIFKKYTVEAYLFPLLFSFFVAILFSGSVVVRLYRKEKTTNDYSLSSIVKSGLAYQAGILMFVFCNRFGYYLMNDTAKVGLYSSAVALTESILIFATGVSPILLSTAANIGKNDKTTDMALSLSKVSLALGLLGVGILVFLPETLFVFVLGKGFEGIRHIMLIYSPGVLLMGVFIIISNYFLAIGKQKIVLLSYGLGFISTLILAPVLIKKNGVEGAAYSANIANLVMVLAICSSFIFSNGLTLKRFFSLKEDYLSLIK